LILKAKEIVDWWRLHKKDFPSSSMAKKRKFLERGLEGG
jgi:hypothetical protein